jgi:Arm DNA-binding domain
MVKLKTILDVRRAKAGGTYTILFRITNRKEVKYLPFGVSIFQNQWDEKSSSLSRRHPNASVLNESLSKRFYELQKVIVALEDSDGYSFEKLKLLLTPKPTIALKLITFKTFSMQMIDDMKKTNRTGNALVYLTAAFYRILP